MRQHIDEHHQPMERIEARVEGGVPRRHQEVPRVRALAGVLSANLDAVARAIEDLGRSGHRPLRLRPMSPDPASMGPAWDGGATRDGGVSPHR